MTFRFDSSLFSKDEQIALSELLESTTRPFLSDGKGSNIEIPEPLYRFLVHLLRQMQQGNAMVMIHEKEAFTTQAAAHFLGMSRQYVVQLLENGAIPYHKVGSHRRIAFEDLLAYQKARDAKRRTALDDFFGAVDNAGLYDKVPG